METTEKTTEFRPDNYLDILREFCSLDWIKSNAKFYLLSHKDKSAHALIWKTPGSNGKGWNGVRMKREYHKDKGYYMDFEPLYIDMAWAIDGAAQKNHDITSDFATAVALANQHTI